MNSIMDKETARRGKMEQFARTMGVACLRGIFGSSITPKKIVKVTGPRAGALEINVGLQAGKLLRAMQADDCALLRQLIPWPFFGEPAAFMAERSVRIEAGWPPDLANDDIPLSALGNHSMTGGCWMLGQDERGRVLTGWFSDATPSWLVSGTSGSGKTTMLVTAVEQLSRDPENRLVLIDIGKRGDSLRQVARIRGRIGPICTDIIIARSALAWILDEMESIYAGKQNGQRRIIVVVDEVQDLASDRTAAELLKRIVAQGRGARVHSLLATQHGVVSALGGPTVGRNLIGRIGMLVKDAKASEVALGTSSPRADRLLGKGDGYALVPGIVCRFQGAWLDREPEAGALEIEEWPEMGEVPTSRWPSGPEVGRAIWAAWRGLGYRKMVQALRYEDGLAGMSHDRADRLLKLGQAVVAWLDDHDKATDRPAGPVHIVPDDEKQGFGGVYLPLRSVGQEG